MKISISKLRQKRRLSLMLHLSSGNRLFAHRLSPGAGTSALHAQEGSLERERQLFMHRKGLWSGKVSSSCTGGVPGEGTSALHTQEGSLEQERQLLMHRRGPWKRNVSSSCTGRVSGAGTSALHAQEGCVICRFPVEIRTLNGTKIFIYISFICRIVYVLVRVNKLNTLYNSEEQFYGIQKCIIFF
jgi:hypothetical protein